MAYSVDATRRPWFRDPVNEAAVGTIWALAVTNVGLLSVLDSNLFGVACFRAPWVDPDSAAYWLKLASLGGVLFGDVPHLLLQGFVLQTQSASTVTVVAFASSALAIIYAVVERIYMYWLRKLQDAHPDLDDDADDGCEDRDGAVNGVTSAPPTDTPPKSAFMPSPTTSRHRRV